MITVDQADRIIAQNLHDFPTIEKFILESYGCILREDILADRDLPPFHKSLMDGIAIKCSSFERGTRKFSIDGVQAAGEAERQVSENGCVEIMTGAVVPAGCDVVIPIEQVHIEKGFAIVDGSSAFVPFQFIRRQGEDYKKGAKLLSAGCILNAPKLALAASVGHTQVKVSSVLKIAAISTGDELIAIDAAQIQSFQTRQSNVHFIKLSLERTGLFDVVIFHIRDNEKILKHDLEHILKSFDGVVLSGGVSMGKFDFVPKVLKELGVNILFHQVAQHPGKPFLFGKTKEGKPVFGLPGNPVSTQVCTARYVIRHLQNALGAKAVDEFAVLAESCSASTKLSIFQPVVIKCESNAQLTATPVKGGGSGDFASVATSDGFVEIPAGRESVERGFVAKLFRWN